MRGCSSACVCTGQRLAWAERCLRCAQLFPAAPASVEGHTASSSLQRDRDGELAHRGDLLAPALPGGGDSQGHEVKGKLNLKLT